MLAEPLAQPFIAIIQTAGGVSVDIFERALRIAGRDEIQRVAIQDPEAAAAMLDACRRRWQDRIQPMTIDLARDGRMIADAANPASRPCSRATLQQIGRAHV